VSAVMFVSTGLASQWCSACIPRSFTSVEAESPPHGRKKRPHPAACLLLVYDVRQRTSNPCVAPGSVCYHASSFASQMASRYPNRISALFSACVVAVLLCIPWPDAKGPSFAKSIWLTFRDLNKNAVATIGRYRAFQSDLTTPGSGEHVLPAHVQRALAIVRGRGRAVKR
jgi:hypothetical protein